MEWKAQILLVPGRVLAFTSISCWLYYHEQHAVPVTALLSAGE